LWKNKPIFLWNEEVIEVRGVKIEFEKYNEKKMEVLEVSTIELLQNIKKNRRECRIVWIREIMKEEKEKEIPEEFRELLKEYKDVFLEKLLPGLPLDRGENNHRIKVVPEARPVKRNYYQLASKEMEELKKKLEEYIELGHIRPS
jgi:hypothetical protein